jgi:hypothetical protein
MSDAPGTGLRCRGAGRSRPARPIWQGQLHALNALSHVGEPAGAVFPAIQSAAHSEQEYVRSAGRYLAGVIDGTYTPATPVFDTAVGMKRAAQKP